MAGAAVQLRLKFWHVRASEGGKFQRHQLGCGAPVRRGGENQLQPSRPPPKNGRSLERPCSRFLPVAPSLTAQRAWEMRTRPTYTLLPFLGRPGRARARRPLPGARPLGSRSRPRGASALGLPPPCAPWLTAGRGERARDDSSPGTGVSGTHLSPGCSLWKKERTW